MVLLLAFVVCVGLDVKHNTQEYQTLDKSFPTPVDLQPMGQGKGQGVAPADDDNERAEFNAMDIDGNGFISAAELRGLGLDARYLIGVSDGDGDGRVSFDGYCLASERERNQG